MGVIDQPVLTEDVTSGLDALEMEAPHVGNRPWPRRLLRAAVPKLVAVALLLGVWQVVATVWRSDFNPPPSDVWSRFTELFTQGAISGAVFTSLLHGAEGYLIAILAGTPLGLLVARVEVVRLAIGSMIAALQSLPSVVWAIPGVMWFKGSAATVLFVVIMGALPSIAGGMVSAVDHIPPLLPRVGSALGARGFAMYRHVIVPAALPGYVAGLKQAWAFSWRSLMAAEIIVNRTELGRGLGQLLNNGHDLLDFPAVYVAILVILVVGVLVDALVFAPLDRGIRRRRGLSAA